MDDLDHLDTIIIGAGQAGPGLASTLDGRGERVALVQEGPFGGTCLNDGCRPTKALRASARAAHVARTSVRLGVHVDDVRVDLAAAVARKDDLISGWRNSYTDHFTHHDTIAYLVGRARLVGTGPDGLHRVRVADRTIAAPRVVLNTGARSVPPSIAGLDGIDWYDHHRILDLTTVPDHLVVIGGSYIGLELGQIYARFGAKVTVLEHADRIIGREDPEISRAIGELLADEGITIRTSVTVTAVDREGTGAAISLDDDERLVASHVLIAAGRVPNSDDLGLETVGVTTDARGYIVTDDHFATDVDGIYALGDVNGRGAFTHTSYQDYEILADHLAGGERSVAHRTTTYALFTDPPLGRVGLTEEQVREAGIDYSVASYPMARLTRAALDGETAGLIKLLVDNSTGEFVGAAALGLHGDEIVQTVSALMHAGVPASIFDTWLPIHPTVAEFFPTIVAQLGPPTEPDDAG
jgi:pyruvate/2-oxoglutarate dehydrogenase complex dihydrolipoamide dehydrogenase (E3) component